MRKNLCKVIAVICLLLFVTSTSVLAAGGAYPVKAATLTADLTFGSTGDEVVAVQQRLTELGYNPGPVDGYYGYVTQTAVMLFQAVNGLYVDGVVGPYTRNALFGSVPGQTIVPAVPEVPGGAAVPEVPEVPAQPSQPDHRVQLSLGSSGEDVLEVQQILLSLGYNPGPLDGYFGQVTEAAVKEFQKANNLYVDGVVGTFTYNVLRSPDAVARPDQIMDASWDSIYGKTAEETEAETETAFNIVKLTFYEEGWYVARMEVQLYDKTDHTLKWIYTESRAKGQKATVTIDADRYEINRVGYQIWFFGWDNDYMNVPYANTDNATEFTLSGSGDYPEFTWK